MWFLDSWQRYGEISVVAKDSLAELPLGLSFQKVSHDEGLAPYFRENLRSELKALFNAKTPTWRMGHFKGRRGAI
jgi:hypothetical protein